MARAAAAIEPAERIECAIHVIDTIILNLDGVGLVGPIFGHGNCPHYG
jgi:hypothetical protein